MLHHNFRTKSHNLPDLFQDVQTLSKFMNKLDKQAQIDSLRYDPLKYMGDGFEFFIELFLSLHPVDNRVGVYDYIPNQENDNGVDGIGMNIRGEKCVVQVKYRSNVTELLSANKDSLSNLFTDGMLAHGVTADMTDINNYKHFVFTTADGLHFYTDLEMFKGKVKCIGYKQLRLMIDNNIPFWNKCREVVSEFINLQKKPILPPIVIIKEGEEF